MAKEVLYLKTGKTTSTASSDTNAQNGWVDAYLKYGLSLEDGALSKLIAPAANKKPVGNSNALTGGVAYLGSSVGVKDERQLSLDVHICASTKADFWTKYSSFCAEILDHAVGDHIRLKHVDDGMRVHHFVYQNCEPFMQFQGEMAKFTLILLEPHPELITEEQKIYSNDYK